jgi:hypothetical protein
MALLPRAGPLASTSENRVTFAVQGRFPDRGKLTPSRLYAGAQHRCCRHGDSTTEPCEHSSLWPKDPEAASLTSASSVHHEADNLPREVLDLYRLAGVRRASISTSTPDRGNSETIKSVAGGLWSPMIRLRMLK